MTTTPWDVLTSMLRADAAAPRVTFYERTPGPTSGERIELSGKVLANWVSKAANLLSEEFDVGPGTAVCLLLPAAHWRTTYWCLAAWALGAEVTFVDADNDDAAAPDDVEVLVTCVPEPDFTGDQVVVSLPMLARAASVEVPAGALDEAKELSTFADVFTPFDEPSGSDVALVADGGNVTYRDLVTSDAPASRRYLASPDPATVLRAWATGGSVVLVRGDAEADDLERLLAQESANRD